MSCSYIAKINERRSLLSFPRHCCLVEATPVNVHELHYVYINYSVD